MSSFHEKVLELLITKLLFKLFSISKGCKFNAQKSYLSFINHYKHNTAKH